MLVRQLLAVLITLPDDDSAYIQLDNDREIQLRVQDLIEVLARMSGKRTVNTCIRVNGTVYGTRTITSFTQGELHHDSIGTNGSVGEDEIERESLPNGECEQ